MHAGSYLPKRGYSTISSHASVPKSNLQTTSAFALVSLAQLIFTGEK